MKVKNLSLSALLFLTQICVVAQITPDTLWTRTFGGIGSDQAIAVTETFDNLFKVKSGPDYGLSYAMFHKQSRLFVTHLIESDTSKFKSFLINIQKGEAFDASFKNLKT